MLSDSQVSPSPCYSNILERELPDFSRLLHSGVHSFESRRRLRRSDFAYSDRASDGSCPADYSDYIIDSGEIEGGCCENIDI